jgi:hypothetical protein
MTWEAHDLTPEKIQRLQEIHKELEEIFTAPETFESMEEIWSLTPKRAEEVRIATRRLLLLTLLTQEYHMHELDDCGDYLIAATENWYLLFNNLWVNDFQNEVSETQEFLTNFEKYPWGGCDGEIRYELFGEGENLSTPIRQNLGLEDFDEPR